MYDDIKLGHSYLPNFYQFDNFKRFYMQNCLVETFNIGLLVYAKNICPLKGFNGPYVLPIQESEVWSTSFFICFIYRRGSFIESGEDFVSREIALPRNFSFWGYFLSAKFAHENPNSSIIVLSRTFISVRSLQPMEMFLCLMV